MSRLAKIITYGTLVIVATWLVASTVANAQQPPPFIVQHNGSQAFTANALQHADGSPVYNFCDTPAQCGSSPPPPDPGAYQTLLVTWVAHTPMTQVTDVTQFFNLFGHILPNLPVQQWPGANGTTVKFQDSTPRYLRLHLAMPVNAGTATHILKAVSYGASPGMRAKFAVVDTGAPWPSGPDNACWKSSQPFSDQPVLYIRPGTSTVSFCGRPLGTEFDVLVDLLSSGYGVLSWY